MNRWLPAALALGSLVLMGTGSAYAQASELVQAKIPFAFKVGQATLPAGEYRLWYDPADLQGALTVRSVSGRHQAFVLAEPVQAKNGTPNANKLVFEREGPSYVLSEVFTDDSTMGLEVVGTHPAN